MLKTLAATIVAGLLLTSTSIAAPSGKHTPPVKHRRGCNTFVCDRWADGEWLHNWIREHPRPQATAVLTWYSTEGCDPTGGGGSTANDTTPEFGEVANSVLAFGTVIEVSPPILGRSRFTVEDRFGGQEASDRFDVWVHCPGGGVPGEVRYRILR